MRSGRVVGVGALLIAALVLLPGPAQAAPGDVCPSPAPVDGTIDVATVDASAVDGDRNHLAGDVAGIEVDYLSPPGESLDDSIDSVLARYGIPVDVEMATEMIERSVLVSMRRTTEVVACVDDPVGFVEVELTDPRLSYTGDPITDPGGVRVDAGYLAVTVERLRTRRPVLEFSVSGTVPQVPGGPPPPLAGAPVVATPTFVG